MQPCVGVYLKAFNKRLENTFAFVVHQTRLADFPLKLENGIQSPFEMRFRGRKYIFDGQN